MINSEKKKLKCAGETTQTSTYTKKLTDQIKPRAVIIIVLRNVILNYVTEDCTTVSAT